MTLWMKTLALLALCLLAGCPGGNTYKQPSTATTVQDVIAKLDAARKARTSFRVETLMDYWLGKDRAKGTVYVMGTTAKQVWTRQTCASSELADDGRRIGAIGASRLKTFIRRDSPVR